jgi:ATP-dependent Clp protease adaptor protein ClpS
VPQINAARYDADYPTLGYANRASHNAFARLQQRLDNGELQLRWRADRGYLDDLLAALNIDTSSQVLVYSKTSLQIDGITAAKPRAVYFNDEAYVGFVQGMPLLELAALDDELGLVFYTLTNQSPGAPRLDREAATQIMLKIHLDGKGVCGVYSRDVAATKVDQVLDAAKQAGHPLQCVSEPIE